MVDFEKIGFKCGLEFHQELSGRKLFCHCSTDLKEENLQVEFSRKLRAVAGEGGEVDIAAAYEQLRDRAFIYNGYKDEACLVDADCEPPHSISEEALKTALEVATLFKLKIPERLCVMRKIVSDGSACPSFQRTIIVGLETESSFLETSQGQVKILQLNLEEDACKIIKKEGNKVYYSLSRQGIPLLELGTGPQIKSPEHALEVAETIGMVFRSFHLAKRGIGTIRQDINVSIKDGARIEVKGWQDLKTLPKLIENEALRQYNLLKIKEELQAKGLRAIDVIPQDVTKVFSDSKSKIVRKIINEKGIVMAAKLPNFGGLLKEEICPGKTFGKELAEYAVAYGTKGMIHSDEDLKKYELEDEFKKLKEILKAGGQDLIVVIAEKEFAAKNAIHAVSKRAKHCLIGVPEETRVPDHINAISSYARPLPGSSRLYPETDIPIIEVTEEILESIRLPELISEKAIRLEKKYCINEEFARQIARKDAGFFEKLVAKFKNLEPNFIANTLLNTAKEIKTRYEADIENIQEKDFEAVLSYIDSGQFTKEAALPMLLDIANKKELDLSKFASTNSTNLEEDIKKIIKENKGASFNAIMGEVMKKYRGAIDGKKAAEIIKKLV